MANREKLFLSDSDDDIDEKTRLLSSSDSSSASSRERSESPEPPRNPQFSQPAPSPLKRFSLLVFLVLLLWMGFKLRDSMLGAKKKPQIIHASRYSKEYKFRPAASPIITETLKDGRVRLRGAAPTPTATTTPAVTKKRRPGAGKAAGKRKGINPKRKKSGARI